MTTSLPAVSRAEHHCSEITSSKPGVDRAFALKAACDEALLVELDNGTLSTSPAGLCVGPVVKIEFNDGSCLERAGDSAWADQAWRTAALEV